MKALPCYYSINRVRSSLRLESQFASLKKPNLMPTEDANAPLFAKKTEWGRIVAKLENVSASKPETTSIIVAVVIVDTNVYFSTWLNCEIFLPVLECTIPTVLKDSKFYKHASVNIYTDRYSILYSI